jgi:hypothetical protein
MTQKLSKVVDSGTEAALSEIVSKTVNVTIRSLTDEVYHKFTELELISVEKQKTTGMKNAPEKRVKDGKAYTPAMLCLQFTGGNSLVFVIEDFKLLIRYKGVCFLFSDYAVDIIESGAI